MLTSNNTVLVVMDVQDSLLKVMHNKDEFLDGIEKLIKGASALNVPIVWTEQVPDKLGVTARKISSLLGNSYPISKSTFSGCGNQLFIQKLEDLHCTDILLCGLETHVCIYQTAVDLLRYNYNPQVVADAVTSRTALNKTIGLEKMRTAGVQLTSTETALFELVKSADSKEFKEILNLVK